MKHFLLSIQQPDGPRPEPAVLEEIMRDVQALDEELRREGAWVFSDGLEEPAAATVLRWEDDEVRAAEGPWNPGSEHVGGICIVKAADLEAALAWGRKLTRATTLPVEVRPFQTDVG